MLYRSIATSATSPPSPPMVVEVRAIAAPTAWSSESQDTEAHSGRGDGHNANAQHEAARPVRHLRCVRADGPLLSEMLAIPPESPVSHRFICCRSGEGQTRSRRHQRWAAGWPRGHHFGRRPTTVPPKVDAIRPCDTIRTKRRKDESYGADELRDTATRTPDLCRLYTGACPDIRNSATPIPNVRRMPN